MLRAAHDGDLEAVEALLAAASLPVGGVAAALGELVVDEHDGAVCAAAALELHGDDALLRSVVVAPARRGHGLAAALVEDRVARAAARGARDVYLLTTTAEGWFLRHGFEHVERDATPPAIRATEEFAALCPASAVVMRRAAAGAS